VGNPKFYAALFTGLVLSTTAPAFGQTVSAGAYIPGHSYEFYSQYYSNSSLKWDDGVPTIYNGLVSPISSASLTSSVADAHASANINTGTTASYTLGLDGNYANAISGFNDTLNFTVSGADASTVTPIHVIASIHSSSRYFYESTIQVGFGDASVAYVFDTSLDSWTWSNIVPSSNLENYWTSSDGYTRTFDMTYDLVGGSQSLGYITSLSALSTFGITTDFTGDVKFILPSNVTFSSASGQFLTGGVPEPASWAMMLAGFGMAGMAMRRRQPTKARLA